MKEMPSKRWLSILEILSLDKTKRYLPEIGFSLPMLPTLQAFIRYYHEVDGFKESLEDEQKIRQNFSRELTKYFGDEYYKLIYDLVYRWSFDFDIENWQIIIFLSTRRDLEFYLTAFEDKFDFIGNTILDKRKQMLRKKKRWQWIADRPNKSDWDLYLQNMYKFHPNIMSERNPATGFSLMCGDWYIMNTLKLIFNQFTESEIRPFVNGVQANAVKYYGAALKIFPEFELEDF